MSNFFSHLYKIISNRLVRFILILLVIVLVIYSGYDVNKEKINEQEVERIISKIKEDKNDIKKHGIERNKVVKKIIIKEKEEETKEDIEEKKKMEEENKKRQEGVKEITNVFLKFKLLEDEYQKKLKEKRINYKRVAKYGDMVYYESEMDFGNPNAENPVIHLFLRLEKNEMISERLVNKKIGQLASYTQNDLINQLPEDVGNQIRANIDKKLEQLKGMDVPFNMNVIYKIKILDFIDKDTVEKLNLDEVQNVPSE